MPTNSIKSTGRNLFHPTNMGPRKHFHAYPSQKHEKGISNTANVQAAVPEDRTALILLANVMLERDDLIAKCNRYQIERAEFQHTAAKYCLQREEMTLEMNLARESMMQNRMMMDSEQRDVDIARFHLLQQDALLQDLLKSLNFAHPM